MARTVTGSRSLARLPEKSGTAAIEFVYGPLAENPQRVGNPFRFELEGLHVARRGGYRVIYEVDEGAHRVVTHVIEHRADAYRRR